VTSQGTAHGRFTRAIQQRNLWAAETSLRELGSVALEDALGYLDLLAEQKPEKLERAAVRWHGRLETEAAFLSLAESQLALAALAGLVAGERDASPRSAEQTEADQALGLRGEALVYREEVKRVRALGFPKSRVVWVSKSNPGANHDILSVDSDGNDLFIEVKATTGRHGSFNWPRAEFELALGARKKYVLYRVYEADTACMRPTQPPPRSGLRSIRSGPSLPGR
jgi:hypothetical protein